MTEHASHPLGRYEPTDSGPLRTVVLLRFPLQLYARSTEHHDEIMREFALLALAPPEPGPHHDVPSRLLELVDILGRQFGRSESRGDQLRDAALARGESTVDLTYEVPLAAAQACRVLGSMLDEADEFCRAGDQMLSLATPADGVAFRQWYLGQIIDQLDGAPPAPWPGSLD